MLSSADKEDCAYVRFENVYIEQGMLRVLGPPPTRTQVDCIRVEDISISSFEVVEREREDKAETSEYLVSFVVSSHSIANSNKSNRSGSAETTTEDDLESEDQARSRSRTSSSSSSSGSAMNSFAKAMGGNIFGWGLKKPAELPVDDEDLELQRTVCIICQSEDKGRSFLKGLNNEIKRVNNLEKAADPGTPLLNASRLSGGSAGTPSSSCYPPLSRSSPVTDSEESIECVERERQVYRWLQMIDWKPTTQEVLSETIHFPDSSSKPLPLSFSLFSSSQNKKNLFAADTVCFQTSVTCDGRHGEELLNTILNMDFIDHLSPFRSHEVLRVIEESVELVRIEMNDDSNDGEGDKRPGMSSDLVVRRSFRKMDNGALVVCLDSASAVDFPPPVLPGCRRRDINAAYVIEEEEEEEGEGVKTMVRFVCNLDIKGLTISESKDEVLGMRRHLESILETGLRKGLHTPPAKACTAAGSNTGEQGASFFNTPYPATCPTSMSSEPEASSFRVRGPSYLRDSVKVPSAPHILKLCLVDLFKTSKPTENICARPDNRVHQALERGEQDFYFVLNIMVPIKKGQTFSYVVYWTGDRARFHGDGPFANIARTFFDDDDDDYRNNRFKLIPKMVDGPYVARVAVKDKPTLLGNKLKQYYHRGDNYFEVDVDVSSSVIANNIVGMCLGVSTAIVVDMGICLQGNEEDELPEVMLASVTGVYLDTKLAKEL